MCAEHRDKRSVILVVDEDPTLRAAIESALTDQFPDVAIRTAENGVAAWEIACSGAVDLLISGVVIADLGGFQLLRRVREDRRLADMYVMLMTGVASPEDLFAAMDEGADDCLLKPFRWNELIARVRAGLRRVEATRRHAARADELERLNDRHTEFLSMVSHEIRTPLSAILSAANVLMRYGSKRPESVERFAKVIHQEGRRLTRLINNLLDLAKIEAGHVEWSFAPAAVDELVRDVQESFSALVGERNLRFEVEPWPEPVVVELDRDKITQVLVNLVSNSIKHSPDGAAVRLRYRPYGRGVRLEVEDEGAGIPAGREEQIFDRFEQLGVDDQRRGSGLGLTISRQIVEKHGGRIWAEPGRTHGALFVVELPGGSEGRGRDGSV
ncbi:MAG TPA: histidine kinase dimerization/phospho-acceptor domain-containing protein [Thermoanaerobaculaceae bacterium]|nr:histidine kinase dimerization/phospho-acceptor domain-containing protein [Thermoanaerobaculaceae bacterium]